MRAPKIFILNDRIFYGAVHTQTWFKLSHGCPETFPVLYELRYVLKTSHKYCPLTLIDAKYSIPRAT